MTERKTLFKLLSILLCGVAVLWLAASCGEERATAAIPLPTPALADAGGEERVCGPGPADSTVPENMARMTEEEVQEHYSRIRRAREIVSNQIYDDYSLFLRQPNYNFTTTGFLKDEHGEWTDQWGITIWVTEKVDQGTLPPEDRIPDTLDGVPVRISEGEPLRTATYGECTEYRCGGNQTEGGEIMETTPEITDEYIHEVRLKYDPLFWRQPNVFAVGEGLFRDANGDLTGVSGILVTVSKKVKQSQLPPEDRIPDCLEGVPIQIVEEELSEFQSLEDLDEEGSNGGD